MTFWLVTVPKPLRYCDGVCKYGLLLVGLVVLRGSVFSVRVLPSFLSPAANGAVPNALRPFTTVCVAVSIFGDAISGPS
jgi:hypothetical protein